jgi:hypothetical protein
MTALAGRLSFENNGVGKGTFPQARISFANCPVRCAAALYALTSVAGVGWM